VPNYCFNTLEVTGPADSIKSFAKKARGHTSSYNSFNKGGWEVFDDIRIASIASMNPEPGKVSDLSFHALHPVPAEIRRLGFDSTVAKKVAETLGIKYPGMGGADWQRANWGTKWEPDVQFADVNENYIRYEFYTPWTPPLEFVEHIAKEWPDLTFEIEYREEGMCFEGGAFFVNGNCESEWEGEIEPEDEEE
jgi:hypothetical protein